jgi:hypothetical protein
MNTSAPLPPEQLDELLSADLDGEFDDAARDFGMEPADARERIAVTPGAKERELSLAVARAALAEVPTLDDAIATRLRAEATAPADEPQEVDDLAARRRKRYRVLASTGAIAAACALVLGIVANANSSSDHSTKTALAAPPARNVQGAPTPSTVLAGGLLVPNLGEAETGDALAERLNDQFEIGAGASTAYRKEQKNADGDQALVDTGTNTVVSPSFNERQAAPSATKCDKVAHDLTGVNDPPISRATGKVGGAPVLVYVFRSGTNEIVLMLNTKCQFVYRQARPAS